MQKITLYLSLLLGFVLSDATRPACAQDKFYIRLESATQGAFKPNQPATKGNGFMECTSIAFLSTGVNSGSAKSNGVQQHEPLKVMIKTAVASPQILQDSWTNKVIKIVQLEFCHTVKDQEQPYMKIDLNNAVITGVVLKSDSEEVTFKYASLSDVETP
jgi:type VI secretion system Hcp family effector